MTSGEHMRKCCFITRKCCFLSLLALGCATLPPAPSARADTQVNAPFGRTWEAVVDYFARASIPIKTIDRASGIIAAEAVSLPGDSGRFGVCKNQLRRFDPEGASFNALVRGDSTQAVVRVTATWMAYGGGAPGIRCQTNDVWEREFEAAIKTKAEAAR